MSYQLTDGLLTFFRICLTILLVSCSTRTRPAMERGLHERDRVGLQDFVLLENYKSEEAFIDNLRKRFQENLIYVSIVNECIVAHNNGSLFNRHTSVKCWSPWILTRICLSTPKARSKNTEGSTSLKHHLTFSQSVRMPSGTWSKRTVHNVF